MVAGRRGHADVPQAGDGALAGAAGLWSRPALEPGVATAVAAAVLELWPRAPAADPSAAVALAARYERAASTWRFSGRSWTRARAPGWERRPWAR